MKLRITPTITIRELTVSRPPLSGGFKHKDNAMLESFQSKSTVYYRSVFLSDFHIGAKTFDAAACLEFLKSFDCDYLYLVGDIIDGWKLNKRWYWKEEYSDILDELVRKKESGTLISYLPGNHDDEVRHILPFVRTYFAKKMGIRIQNKIIHTCASGKKFLVLHGDQFDTNILSEKVLKTHHFISGFLGGGFTWLWEAVRKHPPQPFINISGSLKRFSFAKYLSKHGRLAIQTLNNFEGMVYKLIKSRELDGVICGHTHIPVIKTIRDITYANCGGWLRTGHTALIESLEGSLELVDWPSTAENTAVIPCLFAPLKETNIKFRTPSLHRQRETRALKKMIKRIWPQKTKRKSLIESSYQKIRSSLTPVEGALSLPKLCASDLLSLQNTVNTHRTPAIKFDLSAGITL